MLPISITTPSAQRIERFRLRCEDAELNDPRLNPGSLDDPPSGYVTDTYGAPLGAGEATYRAAVQALDDFAMYPPSMARVHTGGDPAPLAPGSVYVAHIWGFGVHALLPGRIVEVLAASPEEPLQRHGFTFATVRGHVKRGVERFEVNWHRDTDAVHFAARAISRSGPLLLPVAPLTRNLQVKFHRLSPPAMLAATERNVVLAT